jgi:prephenate dehydratase
MVIYYLGPRGTYSELAAEKFADKAKKKREELIYLKSFEEIARSVASPYVPDDFGLVAYYNFLEGLVQESLDAIYENNLHVIDMIRVPVSFALGQQPESKDASVVYSHQKALAQCSQFLSTNYDEATRIPVGSTTEGILHANNRKQGLVIARKDVLEKFGFNILADDIGNATRGRQNYTDFYVVSQQRRLPTEADTLTMIAVTPYADRVGLLKDVLDCFEAQGINLAKIHSRPSIVASDEKTEPQMFYLEVKASPLEERFVKSIREMSALLNHNKKEVVRVLGSYAGP